MEEQFARFKEHQKQQQQQQQKSGGGKGDVAQVKTAVANESWRSDIL
jgi:hypothetical protein